MSPDLIPLAFPKHYSCGGVYAKELLLAKVGQTVQSHSHVHDHLSLLATGTVHVTVDGQTTEYTGPTAVVVKAGAEHLIEAVVVPVVWYCVHEVPEGLRGEAMLDDVVRYGNNSSGLQSCNARKKLTRTENE